MQVYHELTQAGEAGLSFEEILERVKDRVPAGYAWRKYQAQRVSKLASQARRRGTSEERTLATVRSSEPMPGERTKAIRFTIKESLKGMTNPRSRTAIKRPDGRYAVGIRPPVAMPGLEGKYDEDGQITRRQVALMEFLRVARPLVARVAARERERPTKHLPAISTVLWKEIVRLVEAHTPQQPAPIMPPPPPPAPPASPSTMPAEGPPQPSAEVLRILEFVQRRGGRVIRRDVLSSVKAFNARTLDRVLEDYQACYPGTVFYEDAQSKRGVPFTRQVILAPGQT